MELNVRRITLKALANFSPGFALKSWVKEAAHEIRDSADGTQPFQGSMRFPRVAKAQPWAEISERLQRYRRSLTFTQSLKPGSQDSTKQLLEPFPMISRAIYYSWVRTFAKLLQPKLGFNRDSRMRGARHACS